MDSLHLFTIPKWLPNTLLPEIWAIIFYWKWRLEMKDIHETFFEQMKRTHYCTSNLFGFDSNGESWYTKGIKGNIENWYVLVKVKEIPRGNPNFRTPPNDWWEKVIMAFTTYIYWFSFINY